jgi:hypothetical protein
VDDDAESVQGFQPWHLFFIGGLLASSLAAVAVRGTSPENVVFVCLTVLAAAWASYLFYRTVWPLLHPEAVSAPDMVGGRTRAALEREKVLTLRALKELEFDRAMGKVSDEDYQEMTGRLRSRALRLIKQLDSGGAAYQELIERELSARASGGRAGAGVSSTARASVVLVAAALLGGGLATPAAAQMGGMGGGMPDARAMSGIARPSETVPSGSVSVRLVRVQLSNNIVDFPVTFTVDGKAHTVKTGPTGHAVLSGIVGGAAVKASATVDGEVLESQMFQMPEQGGVVLMLVASDKGAAEQMQKTAVPGTVRIGGQSRIITEFQDEELEVFYLFELVNSGSAPVKSDPVVFELPDEAIGVTVLEGSSKSAVAKGRQVTVTGPFAPGATTVQIAFSVPPRASLALRQKLPVAMDQVAVMAEKAGAMTLASANVVDVREASDSGRQFILANGPGLAAGSTLALDINGLPHHPTWPRNVALGLGLVILAFGAWYAASPGQRTAAAAARQQLEARRERAFGQLAALDERLKAGEVDEPTYQARRAELMVELERIYGELDTEQGLAA